MKRAMSIAAILLFCGIAYAESWKVTVSTSSVIVAPSITATTTNAWATGAIAQGTYLTNSTGRIYWTPNGGTATSGQEPTHTRGIATGTDSIDWLALAGSRRSNLEVQSITTGDIWIKRGGTAVADECTLLNGRGAARQYSNYKGSVEAIAGSSQTVVVQEW